MDNEPEDQASSKRNKGITQNTAFSTCYVPALAGASSIGHCVSGMAAAAVDTASVFGVLSSAMGRHASSRSERLKLSSDNETHVSSSSMASFRLKEWKQGTMGKE